ncbi:MAG: 6-phosphofructokinase [Bacteroidales bacterium]|nr:6-phosphofructokinase [Bacteroidales bacterium]
MKKIIIGQSGGPTAVINSSVAGVFKRARELGVETIYGMVYGIEGFFRENIIDLGDYLDDPDNFELLKRTPSAFLSSCRYKLPDMSEKPEVYEMVFDILDKYEIDAMFYIGGNDSMDTIKMLSDYARENGKRQLFVGIPKTIDNDLPITDHCPGYGSASKYIATSMKEIIRDNASYGARKPTVCIVEIMGRHAGWLTAAAALADDDSCEGVDAIYLPEIVFDVEKFIARVKELAIVKSSIVIAVSEGIAISDGRFVCELSDDNRSVDAFGHKQLSGCAKALADIITNETGLKTRAIEFSTLQRAASHISSLTDINEAQMVGERAVDAAFDGNTGTMVIIKREAGSDYKCGTDIYDIHNIANVEKKVPLEWIDVENNMMKPEYLQYAKPLIMGELNPVYKDGLPVHLVRK